ncbi:MAG: heme o synthase [Chloroflexota bacterium]|nr:heme o synthase [Dehalococcoidia bacterium]MDW8252965.1 heme o synthase [Chloroflexota bacterium]
MIRRYLPLTKPVVVLLLLCTTVMTMLFAAGELPSWPTILATIIGGAFAAGGANAVNCFFDRDIDSLMARTRRRPTASGVVAPNRALGFGLALIALAVLLLGVAVNWLTALLGLSGALLYIVVYTLLLKRATIHNIVIGGAAGAIPPLVGWAAATGRVDLPAWYLFAIIFFWTPPHFWALALMTKRDYAAAGVPMLPVVRGDDETRRQIVLYAILLLPVTMLLFGGGTMGWLYLTAAVLLTVVFIWYAVMLYREKTTRRARALFTYSNNYLALLFAAMAVDRLLTR